jgi:FtsP/CotA-like multicopper oxidase with cupredoxin domain
MMLDDILIEDGRVAPFSRTETTYAAMGRYGNVLLVNGESTPAFTARRNEVVRVFLTNTANTRVFNVGFSGARMKVIGGDSGRSERETFVDQVMLAPSERVVVDVLFDRPGTVSLEQRTPGGTSTLATIAVSTDDAAPSLAESFATLRSNPEWAAKREGLMAYLHAQPDKTLAFTATMSMGEPDASDAHGSYACPMHPEVVSDAPGRCPLCGMALLSATVIAQAGGHGHHGHHEAMDHSAHEAPEHGGHAGHAEHSVHAGHQQPAPAQQGHVAHHGHHQMGHHQPAQADDTWRGIEWEDDMVEVNRITTPANMRWTLADRESGAEGHAIDWRFRVGERVKIRLVNEMDSDHPMHHPFHIHGAGRFLVLSRDGVTEPNLTWKDTVLVRTGETVDILLEVTNPGRWMAHCHIAEHHESGMMLSFTVTE